MTDDPSNYRERVEAWLDETNWDRRLLLLVLVLLLVILGSGLGTFILNLGDGETPVTTETPIPPTATEAGGGPGGPATPEMTDTETPVETPEDPDTPTETSPPDDPDPPEPTPTEAPDGGGGGGGGTPTPSGDLLFTSNQQMLTESGVVPGESGTGTTTVESDSDESGELRITGVAIADSENGITEPESSVDSSPNDGELEEHLEVRIALEDEDGNVDYVLGTDSGYVDLEDLPARTPSSASPLDPGEEMTVRTEWRLPSSTGNEVQSDGVDFDVTLELRST